MTYCKRARLYCGYEENSTETTALQNVWEVFPQPSGGYFYWRTTNDFTIDVNGKINFDRSVAGWFKIDTICNVYKGTGGNASRNVEVVWKQNGVKAGPIRGSHMNNNDSQIISGTGEVYLAPGDYLEPCIRNIENDDKILLTNVTINIFEEVDW